MKTTRTQVSRSNPAIKAIIESACPGFKGRRVTVVEAADTWEHRQYLGDLTTVVAYGLEDGGVSAMPRPGYLSDSSVAHYARAGVALVFHFANYGANQVEIVVRAGEFDHLEQDMQSVMAVALDAAIAAGKKRAAQAAFDVLAEQLWPEHAGRSIAIRAAVVEARAAALAKAEAAA